MKFVQIAAASVGDQYAAVFALDESGALWKKVVTASAGQGRAWVLITPPGADEPAGSAEE